MALFLQEFCQRKSTHCISCFHHVLITVTSCASKCKNTDDQRRKQCFSRETISFALCTLQRRLLKIYRLPNQLKFSSTFVFHGCRMSASCNKRILCCIGWVRQTPDAWYGDHHSSHAYTIQLLLCLRTLNVMHWAIVTWCAAMSRCWPFIPLPQRLPTRP